MVVSVWGVAVPSGGRVIATGGATGSGRWLCMVLLLLCRGEWEEKESLALLFFLC